MKLKTAVSLGLIGLVSSLMLITTVTEAAIFGADNRISLSEKSHLQFLAQATAISVLSAKASLNPSGTLNLNTEPLVNFCKDEPLFNQPSLSFSCTGFLVGPDLLVTAGHCVYAVNTPNQEIKNETGLACEVFRWLFDYQTLSDGTTQLTKIPAEKMYSCKRIIYAVQQEKAPYEDYALIQLDRPVVDRMPLKISTATLKIGDPTFMIGHPFGTPQKLTDHGKVILNDKARSSFMTNLDAFEGNSGSPVFNIANEVTGILVSGTPSANTFTDKINRCERVNHCSEDGKSCFEADADPTQFPGFQATGSEVQRILPIVEMLKSAHGL